MPDGSRSHDQLHVGYRFAPDKSAKMKAIVAHRSRLAGVPVSVSSVVRTWIDAHVDAEYAAITGGRTTRTAVMPDGRLVEVETEPTFAVTPGGVPMDAPDEPDERPVRPSASNVGASGSKAPKRRGR